MSLWQKMVVATVAALAICASATAGNPHGVVLDAPKLIQVNYDNCQDPNGNPVACLSVDYTVTNNTSTPATCGIFVTELDFHITFGAPIGAGQTAGGGLTTFYLGQKALTFVLNCDGTTVPGETRRVRVTS